MSNHIPDNNLMELVDSVATAYSNFVMSRSKPYKDKCYQVWQHEKAKLQAIADSLEWISVEDRLPDESLDTIWIWDSKNKRKRKQTHEWGWKLWFETFPYYTHWMPEFEPNPPTEVSGE